MNDRMRVLVIEGCFSPGCESVGGAAVDMADRMGVANPLSLFCVFILSHDMTFSINLTLYVHLVNVRASTST